MTREPPMPGPVWTDPDLSNPHAVADKARRIERMFAAIAPSYDLNNRLHSLGRDQAWRRVAVRLAGVRPGDLVLDVACGTGDLAQAFACPTARQDTCPQRVIGIDFTEVMLRLADDKRLAVEPGSRARSPLSYHGGDAVRLPVADASVDVVSIAFGIRNVTNPASAMAEFYRALRPGGRVVVLEFGFPANPLLRAAYMFYFTRVMPRTASWIARDRSGAYNYLPQSVNTFLNRAGLVKLMREAGFSAVVVRPLTFGIAVCYRGVK